MIFLVTLKKTIVEPERTMFRKLFMFILFCKINCEKAYNEKVQENDQMLGVHTFHDEKIKIDKDTIISRNIKLGKRNSGKTALDNMGGKEPDWSYSSFPKEVKAHVEQFKRNMSDCLKEVQASEKKSMQRLSPKKESPVHGECLIACVLKRNGVIQHGKIHKENLLSLVNKFYSKDTQLMKKLEKQVDRCVDNTSQITDECALAAQLNDCTNQIMANNKHKILVNY